MELFEAVSDRRGRETVEKNTNEQSTFSFKNKTSSKRRTLREFLIRLGEVWRRREESEKKKKNQSRLFQKNYNIDQIIQPSSREQEKQER